MKNYTLFNLDGSVKAFFQSNTEPVINDSFITVEGAYDSKYYYDTISKEVKLKDPCPGHGYVFDYVNKTWVVDLDFVKAYNRDKRNKLLKECDWTQSLDISEEIRTKWAIYRQFLRDIPEQEDQLNVVWPVKPF